MNFSFKTLLSFALAIAVVGSIVYAFLPQPIPVDMTEVDRGRLQVTVDEDGKTRIKERYIVSTPLTGRLQRVDEDPDRERDTQSQVVTEHRNRAVDVHGLVIHLLEGELGAFQRAVACPGCGAGRLSRTVLRELLTGVSSRLAAARAHAWRRGPVGEGVGRRRRLGAAAAPRAPGNAAHAVLGRLDVPNAP